MKIVVALGGNALGDTPSEQQKLVKQTAQSIADLIQNGHEVTLVHGNGPQVGMINNAFDAASRTEVNSPIMPLPECGAMSQGYIGYHLQNAIKNALMKRKIDKDVLTIVTQTIVDKHDQAFKHPSKPIGAFYTKEEAEKLSKKRNLPIIEDSNRGYRFVVSSPSPIDFVERNSIAQLIQNGSVVIASGGGGIPVIQTEQGFQGVSAVIDKDLSSAKLALLLKADVFIILTAVEKVMLNFGKENQQALDKMSLEEAKKHIKDEQFAKGSMLPKIEAAMSFIKEEPTSQAIIASLENALQAIKGKTGTIIYHS